jgi:hypothetical protein
VTKLFDTSSIPDSDAYWNSLTSRVTQAAQPRRSGLSWIGAERAAWLAAVCIVVAAMVGVMSMREATTMGDTAPQAPLTPRDAIGRIFAGASPPTVAELTALLPRDGGESP